jgi:hypothetical protein
MNKLKDKVLEQVNQIINWRKKFLDSHNKI